VKTSLDNLVTLLTCHWLTMTGTAMTTASAVLFVTMLLGQFDNPYIGLLLFIALPGLFVLGLVLIPAGLYRKSKQVGGLGAILSTGDGQSYSVVRLAILIAAATLVNIVLVSTTTLQGVDYMESAAFCGEICHSVMEPQYLAHQSGPHAEIGCVDCHVADRTSSFVYHKVDGLRQVWSLLSGGYDRPIPASGGRVHPAAETCGTCHRMDGAGEEENLRILRSYAEDEATSRQTTVLLLHTRRIHEAHGRARIRYAAEDESLETIPWLSVDGTTFSAGERGGEPERTMDCIDCHNRVGHAFPSAETVVDEAIRSGEIDRSAPFAKRDVLSALATDGLDPEGPLQTIRNGHIFPEMGISWGTYSSNIGHVGCFRCHTANHVDENGNAVGQGCLSCHSLLAVASPDPAILTTLGVREP